MKNIIIKLTFQVKYLKGKTGFYYLRYFELENIEKCGNK